MHGPVRTPEDWIAVLSMALLCLITFGNVLVRYFSDQSFAWQRSVRESAQEAAKQQIALVRKLFSEDVERVRALGVNVHIPTAAEMKEWQIATRRTYARWKVRIEPNLIGKIEQVVEGTRKA